jgi:hypothetical protein
MCFGDEMQALPTLEAQRARCRAIDLVGMLVLGALAAGVVVPASEHRSALRRDRERLQRLHIAQDAIERHRLERGAFPPSGAALGDWDVSHDGDFLPVLVDLGYLEQSLRDPLDSARFHLVYRFFPAGSCSCAPQGGFYVLGLRRFETEHYAARRPGGVPCPHWQGLRDLAHVTGGGLVGPWTGGGGWTR